MLGARGAHDGVPLFAMVGTRCVPARCGFFKTAVEDGRRLGFVMMIPMHLRRARGVTCSAPTTGRTPWRRHLHAIPTGYGVLCLSCLLHLATAVLAWVYALLTDAALGFILLAAKNWSPVSRRCASGLSGTR